MKKLKIYFLNSVFLFCFTITSSAQNSFAVSYSLSKAKNWDTCRLEKSQPFGIVTFSKTPIVSITKNNNQLPQPNHIEAHLSLPKHTDLKPVAKATEKDATEQARTASEAQEVKLPQTQGLQKTKEKEEKIQRESLAVNAKTKENEASKNQRATLNKSSTAEEESKVNEGLGEEYKGTIPKYVALIIGIASYKNDEIALPSLDYPVKDAKRIKEILVNKYAFDSQNIRLLENPNRAAIIDAFEEISSLVNSKDNLLIFYAGHGYFDKEKGFGYWLPADAKTTSKSDWISNTIIRDYLSAISSKHTLLISDACFSGSIFKSRSVMGNLISKISEMYKYPSRRAMTSGNLSQVPDKSFFAEYLIKRLSDNDDPFLPAQTLFYRIYEPVNNNSTATPQFGVVQGTGDEGGDFIFIKKQKK